jgi:hypothetical protein
MPHCLVTDAVRDGSLEADPYFDRSGYVKADLLRIMKGLPLDPEQTVRLRAVCRRAGAAAARSAPTAVSRVASMGRSWVRH